MRRFTFGLLLFLIPVLTWTGCDSLSSDSGGVVTLTGRVLSGNQPVNAAEVFTREFPSQSTTTNQDGLYSLAVEIDSTMTLLIVARKNGIESSATSVVAKAGETIPVESLQIGQTTIDEGEESGEPASISLASQSEDVIGVRESGSSEVANLVFQVVDSVGEPVTLGQAIDVRFLFGERPNGGEFIAPDVARTNNNGEAVTAVTSGTIAGVVQVIAEAEVSGRTIRSQPVALTIHGGLPDQTHFTIGPDRFNFPGLRRFGITNQISVIIGDKYGNPVRTGTAAYFTTNFGVVEGSALTSNQGGGTVQLISANPFPPDGVGIVWGTTADEVQAQVRKNTPVLWTGAPIISVNPLNFQIGGFYTVTLTDRNGNPLGSGQTLAVKAEGVKVKAVGSTDVRLDDSVFIDGDGDPETWVYDDVVRGPGITQFSFGIAEIVDETPEPAKLETVTITTTGPNGGLEIVFGSAGQALAKTDGAVVEIVNDVATIRLEE